LRSTAFRDSRPSSTADALTTYLLDIRAFPQLARAKENELARRIRRGDEDALECLICANLRFVVSVAKKYQHQGVSLADLINEGNLGLLRAAQKFDEAKDVKFISYAVWWIRQAILRALAEHGHAVRVPVSRAGTIHRLARHTQALRQELGREPTQLEVATELGITEREIASTISLTRSYLSLDAPLAGNQDMKLLDYLADEASSAPDDDGDSGLADSVKDALLHLCDREARVLRLYFGFEGNDPLSLEAIGQQLGLTAERARQIKEKALSRLRRPERAIALEAFHER
jgi:RNA polymerase primary sigma factor